MAKRATVVVEGSFCTSDEAACPFYAADEGTGACGCARLRYGQPQTHDGDVYRSGTCPFGQDAIRITVTSEVGADG